MSDDDVPVWRRTWFWLFAAALLLLSLPLVPAFWHIVGPDDAEPAKMTPPPIDVVFGERDARALPDSPDAAVTRVVAARVAAQVIATLPADLGDADIRTGARFDEKLTPAFLTAAEEAITAKVDAAAIAAASGPPCRVADILASDGESRAFIALGRSRRDPRMIADEYVSRLLLARSLVFAVVTPQALRDALRHERDVLAEIRFDAVLLAADPEALKIILPALAAHALPPDKALTKRLAANFDAALDVAPDAGLLAMRDRSPAPADATLFERLARFARKPAAHRREITDMHARFGEILAGGTFAGSRRAFLLPASADEVHPASLLLRSRVFGKLGGDVAMHYFFTAQPEEDSDLMVTLLKFAAFTESRDIFGVAYLMHRRAELLTLLAHVDRTRFDAGATAYLLGLRYRKALAGGKWPKDTERLFDGLMDLYPLDPFTDEPVAYSRKNLTLHSPGADGVDKNGLDDAEFATENAELWEPTIPLEAERETDPGAFGLRFETPRK